MRFSAKHLLVAILFAFAQICASAVASDHMSDPLHAGDDCAVCTTVNADTHDGLPPLARLTLYPPAAGADILPAIYVIVPAPEAKANKARAPPVFT